MALMMDTFDSSTCPVTLYGGCYITKDLNLKKTQRFLHPCVLQSSEMVGFCSSKILSPRKVDWKYLDSSEMWRISWTDGVTKEEVL